MLSFINICGYFAAAFVTLIGSDREVAASSIDEISCKIFCNC